ncbi:MAG: hypothetical protein NTV46_11550 [Verrucomicrobia bacterium]|jgi:hypothetical protein|nr:hypothetical protein [Verrucomicrobiota bacterium]
MAEDSKCRAHDVAGGMTRVVRCHAPWLYWTPFDSTIIRAGSDGRLRYSPAQRQELLGAFAGRSGVSAMNFSRQHGVQSRIVRARS